MLAVGGKPPFLTLKLFLTLKMALCAVGGKPPFLTLKLFLTLKMALCAVGGKPRFLTLKLFLTLMVLVPFSLPTGLIGIANHSRCYCP